MPFELELAGVDSPLLAARVSLTRSLGEPTLWRFATELRREGRGGRSVLPLAEALGRSPIRLRARWNGGEGADVLGPEATVVGARWLTEESVDFLEIDGHATAPNPQPDPFIPRRRVHKATTMRELVERFADVARPVRALLTELGDLAFPDQGRASIIQDGASDWEFFGYLLDQCRLLRPEASWLPLTMVGGVDENTGTEGRWVVAPGLRKAYEVWGDVSSRTIRFRDGVKHDGEARLDFASYTGPHRVPAFPTGVFPSPVFTRPSRRYQAGKWREWRMMDLPRFTEDGSFVWRIEDTLRDSGQGLIVWESRLFTLPPEAQVGAPAAPSPLRPWVGYGTVEVSSENGPWIRVRLPGFQEGEDLVDVRLSTPFSGTDGSKGLHLVPRVGTDVALGWNGRVDASVVLLGNTRAQPTDFATPSLYLEEPFTGQYATVHIPEIRDVTVDSNFSALVRQPVRVTTDSSLTVRTKEAAELVTDAALTMRAKQRMQLATDASLSVSVKQHTNVASSRQLVVQADGAELKMASGVVNTGRGT